MAIIQLLLDEIYSLHTQIAWLMTFIAKYIPLHKQYTLRCPYCGRALSKIKTRKDFDIYKCLNEHCSYYLENLAKLSEDEKHDEQKRTEYKLHYIYREFTKDFFAMDLDSLPENASSFRFSKFDMKVVTLCLTYHINYQISLRRTKDILWDIHGIKISHQQIAKYCKTAAVLVKPFVDHYDYGPSGELAADETYIKAGGKKGYVWLIMDAVIAAIPAAMTASIMPTLTSLYGSPATTSSGRITTSDARYSTLSPHLSACSGCPTNGCS